MNVIQHNLSAINAHRQLGVVVGEKDKSSEKLSSGYKINRAADDAAGLSISEKMRRQIRGLSQAVKNAQDGISLVQIADGALNESQDMLQRMNELAVKAATGTLQSVDREYIDAEVQKLKDEISATAKKTTFNELEVFPANGYSPKDVSYASNVFDQEFQINVGADGTISVSDPMTSASVTSVAAADGWQNLAKHIADELIPNAVSQVLDKFPSLKTTGADINLALRVEYIDGPSNTLAYAQFSYSGNGHTATPVPTSFMVKVDSADFSDSTLNTSAEQMLESTLAHELTHTVMQNTMATGMAYTYPDWFVEGTAQLAGGGFTTGWNEYLQSGLQSLTSETDTGRDTWLADKLKARTVEDNVYGHGYLAAAFLGYEANGGSGAVDAASIAAGMNSIFAELINNGNNLDAAINTVTGGRYTSASAVASAVNNASSDALNFVRQLVYNTHGGAGSVVAAGGLSAAGTSILGNSPSGGGGYTIDSKVDVGGRQLLLQVGSEKENTMALKMFKMSAADLGLADTHVRTSEKALEAIGQVKEALQLVSSVRSYYGASQNRLEHTINNLNNVVENTMNAESLIRDTDMSEEMVRFSNANILQQAGQSMLTQANQSKQGILSLLS